MLEEIALPEDRLPHVPTQGSRPPRHHRGPSEGPVPRQPPAELSGLWETDLKQEGNCTPNLTPRGAPPPGPLAQPSLALLEGSGVTLCHCAGRLSDPGEAGAGVGPEDQCIQSPLSLSIFGRILEASVGKQKRCGLMTPCDK